MQAGKNAIIIANASLGLFASLVTRRPPPISKLTNNSNKPIAIENIAI